MPTPPPRSPVAQAFYRKLFEAHPVPMWVYDLESLAFLAVNDAAIDHYGYSRDEFLGMTITAIRPLEDVPALLANVARVTTGLDHAGTWRHRLRDGTIIDVEITSHVVEWGGRRAELVMALDVTERRRVETTLRASERRFRALIENASDAIALVHADGTIGYLSPATARVIGYDAGDLTGHKALDLVHQSDLEAVAARLEECARAPGSVVSVQAQVRHKDDSWRQLEGRLTNLLQDASVGAIVANYRDVTEEKRLEAQLQQAQRLESIGRLAGGIAHDFNNLLTAILGYTELLELGTGRARDVEALGEIRRAGERARELTQQLLTFARQQMVAPRALSLNDLVETTGRLVSRLLGDQIAVAMCLGQGLWDVEADPVQVEQVLLNLAINARDAMPDGGRLTVETRNAVLTAEDAASHPDVSPGSYVLLAVSDTGTGIPPEALSSIFEPFFTTKPVGQGTGLGLATVYGVVRRAGGHVRVHSEMGRGTTFELYFPRSTTQRRAEAIPPPATPQGGGETVLLVEDDDGVRTLTARVLEQAGYRVLVAANGAEALSLADETEHAIDLLLTDVVMPGMSGRQVAEALAASSPSTKVLYASGYTRNSIGRQGVLEPDVHFLAKPFAPSLLLATVRGVLDGRDV